MNIEQGTDIFETTILPQTTSGSLGGENMIINNEQPITTAERAVKRLNADLNGLMEVSSIVNTLITSYCNHIGLDQVGGSQGMDLDVFFDSLMTHIAQSGFITESDLGQQAIEELKNTLRLAAQFRQGNSGFTNKIN